MPALLLVEDQQARPAGQPGRRTCTPTILDTRPSGALMGVMVSRFQNGVPSFL
jgi:hypothetical protein